MIATLLRNDDTSVINRKHADEIPRDSQIDESDISDAFKLSELPTCNSLGDRSIRLTISRSAGTSGDQSTGTRDFAESPEQAAQP